MKIGAKTVLEGIHLGDSNAVNGTCLMVTEFDTQLFDFTVELSPKMLRKTSLIKLEAGSLVNLERAVQPTSRMGGHFVQGHVDGTWEIVPMEPEGDLLWIKKVVIPLKKIRSKVNLEVDILGKYVERLLSSGFVESFKSS
ncbi:hypothetical protein TB2_047076 [Malus domestica]